jgi:hypothetical protein
LENKKPPSGGRFTIEREVSFASGIRARTLTVSQQNDRYCRNDT